jgi:4-aminobutyrate aminotransferase
VKAKRIVELDQDLISPSERIVFFPLVVDHAKGSWIWDVDGRQYLDFLSGAAVTNIGHRHPRVVSAIKAQSEKFIHSAFIYTYYESPVTLAAKLSRLTPGTFPKRVAYGLSGGDANDAAIKLARTATKRKKILAFLKSYHGTTYGALSLSAITLRMRRQMGPFLPEIYHIPFPDCYRCTFNLEHPSCGLYCLDVTQTYLETVIPPEEVALVIPEPIQGDAGVIVPPPHYFPKLQELCNQYDILFAAEEVQSGMGRTGKWFAIEHWDTIPDIIVTAKALGGGMPLSAVVARKELMESWEAPSNFFTTNANPICCAAALATIQVIEEEKLLDNARIMGEYIVKRFQEMKDAHPLIGDVRGKGLLLGVDLIRDPITREPAHKEVLKLCWRCWEKGLIITNLGNSVLRVAPPLNLSTQEADHALQIIEEALIDMEKGKVPDAVLMNMMGW